MIEGMGTDAETIYNEQGAGQSKLNYRFDLFDGPSMFAMAKVLDEGANKYGANNWRGIPVEDHLNHLIAHAYAYLSGDTQDEHLSHVMCRAMFAQAVSFTEPRMESTRPKYPFYDHATRRLWFNSEQWTTREEIDKQCTVATQGERWPKIGEAKTD